MKRDVAISPVAFKRRMAYFREASEEIAAANLRMLFAASVMTLGLLAVFLLVTPYVIRGWDADALPSGAHPGRMLGLPDHRDTIPHRGGAPAACADPVRFISGHDLLFHHPG